MGGTRQRPRCRGDHPVPPYPIDRCLQLCARVGTQHLFVVVRRRSCVVSWSRRRCYWRRCWASGRGALEKVRHRGGGSAEPLRRRCGTAAAEATIRCGSAADGAAEWWRTPLWPALPTFLRAAVFPTHAERAEAEIMPERSHRAIMSLSGSRKWRVRAVGASGHVAYCAVNRQDATCYRSLRATRSL